MFGFRRISPGSLFCLYVCIMLSIKSASLTLKIKVVLPELKMENSPDYIFIRQPRLLCAFDKTEFFTQCSRGRVLIGLQCTQCTMQKNTWG